MVEINLFSFTPGVFAAVLSLYNWLQTRKPANIVPNNIVEYAIVSSSYEQADILTIPLVFHNEGALIGVITDINIGFKTGKETKLLEIMGRANLKELSTDQLMSMGLENYTQDGYSIILPTYPISVSPGESKTVFLIAVAAHDEKIVPIDVDTKWIVETHFGKNKVNRNEFPFKITKDNYDAAENLKWYRSL